MFIGVDGYMSQLASNMVLGVLVRCLQIREPLRIIQVSTLDHLVHIKLCPQTDHPSSQTWGFCVNDHVTDMSPFGFGDDYVSIRKP